MKKLIPLFLLFFAFYSSQAQISVTPGVSAAALIAGFSGQGLTITNVQINCPGNAYGTFSNGGSTNVGLSNGAILTTGNAAGVNGPNNSASAGACNGTSSGDPDLTAISPLATEDPCVIEFDIVPQCSQLVIRFVFGSEEYPEYVNASYNDAFGFFITGPGPACQNNFYNSTNVATLPNNTTPVSIDNVNASNNSSFYVDNTGGATIQYDGFTTVLTRSVSICPCQTYHFKIAIADAGDCFYDSGVLINFLQCDQFMASTMTSTASSCASTSGAAQITMTNGIGPFTYTWSPAPGGGQGTSHATGLSPGTYTVTVDDGIICSPSYTDAVTITGPVSPTLSINSTNVSCNGGATGSATASISGGITPYTYTWSPSGGHAASATGLSAGDYTLNITDGGGCTASKTITITEPATLTAVQGQTNVLCFGGNNGAANVTVNGGTSPYSYTWSPSGGNAASATGLTANTYSVLIKDFKNCTRTETFTITQPPVVTAVTSQTNNFCGSAITAAASITVSGGAGPYTYTWSPSGGNSSLATTLADGVYTVFAEDVNSCIITKTVNIIELPTFTLTMSATSLTCNNAGNGSATVSVRGGSPPFTFTWSPAGGNGNVASGLSAGAYTVLVEDGINCFGSATINVAQPAVLAATASQTNVLCNGGTGAANVNVTGGTAPYSYTWSPSGGNSSSATGLISGIYTVDVKDAHLCSITNTFNITQPAALSGTSSQTNIACHGGNGKANISVSGGATPYTYSWSPSGGNAATATLTAGTYTVRVTDNNSCTITSTFSITEPPALAISGGVTSSVACNGQSTGSATVSVSGGSPGYTYTWSPSGGNTPTATALSGGTYTLTAKDASACTIFTTIVISQPSALSATPSQTNVNCINGGGTASVSVSGGTSPYSYTWAPSGGNASSATALAGGNYTVTIKDNNLCTITRTFNITQPSGMSSSSSQTNITCHGGTGAANITVSGGATPYTYTWSPSGGNAATATGLSAGNYTVTVKDNNLCTIVSTYTITEPSQLLASASVVSVNCNGQRTGSATLTVSGGTPNYSYTWSPSGSGSSAGALPAGNYSVLIQDINLCSTTLTFVIAQPLALSATATQTNVLCNGGTGMANISVSGGITPYSYTWTPSGGNAALATGLSAGNYTVTVKDNNLCTITHIYNITQPATLTSTSSQTNVSCNAGTNGVANINVSGGTIPYSYTWTPSGGSAASATGLSAGNYTVFVQDSHSCTISSSYTITEPLALTLSAAVTSVNCNGQSTGSASVTLGGGTTPYSYTWAPSGGNAATAVNLPAGTYTLFANDALSCSIVTVVTIAEPSPLTSTSSQTNVLCNGGTGAANISVSGGVTPYTYTWSPAGGNSATAPGLLAGAYTVSVQDANLCGIAQTYNITQPAALSSIPSQTNVLCFGGTGMANVNVSGGVTPYTYTWTPTGGNAATSTITAGSYTVTVTDNNLCVITNTYIITQPPLLVSSVAITSVNCNGQSTGAASLTVSGGAPAYSYTWSPSGGNSSGAVNLAAGSYTALVMDANSCVNIHTFTINQPPLLSSTIHQTSVTCYGYSNGAAALTTTGGVIPYSYTWTPTGAHTSSISSLIAGNYGVTVEDANHCQNTLTASIISPLEYTFVPLTNSVTCHGQATGAASLIVSGNTPPFSYTWSPFGGNAYLALGLSAGNYSVNVLDAQNCPGSQTLTIVEPSALSGTASSSPANCNNADGSATITMSGGTPGYTYTWTPSGGNGAVTTGIFTGQYTCTVHDLNNCQFALTTSVGVINPSVSVSASNETICPRGTTTLTATGSDLYSWTPSEVVSPSSGSVVSASPSVTTTYTVTGSNLYGCTVTDTITIQLFPDPTPSLTVSNNTLCAGGTVSLNATSADSYTWSPSTGLSNTLTNNPTTTLQNSTIYTVTGSNAQGCTGTATILVSVIPLPALTVSTTASTICINDFANITVGGAVSYSWNTGSTANPLQVSPTAFTSYTVTGTDANGCRNTATVSIGVNPIPVVSINSSSVICQGQTATLSAAGASTYSWSTGDPGASISETPTTSTTYSVTGTDVNGCKNTASFSLTVFKTPTINIAGPREACTNADLKLTAQGGSTYTWSTGEQTATVIHTYTVNSVLTVSSGVAGCTPGTASISITVSAPPTLSATVASPVVNLGQNTLLEATGSGTQYSWIPTDDLSCATCSNPIAQPTVNTTYTVEATSRKGCISTATVFVEVDLVCGDLFAPSAFSPNNDGNNDTWCVYGNCIVSIHCEIFNRWGQKVYTINNKEQCWDGKIAEELQSSGVFIYQVQAVFINGESKSLKGNFTLVR